jgi:1,4-alpha-glucan branching enzyme
MSFLRWSTSPHEVVLVVCNFTPVVRSDYRLGVPYAGFWSEVLNSDAEVYGGGQQGNMGGKETVDIPSHGHPYALDLTLPPLAIVFFTLRP